MALSARVVTVAMTATILTADQADARPGTSLAVYVPVGGATVYVGGPGVTTATGYPCIAGSEHFFDLDPTSAPGYAQTSSELVYGIVAASTQAVNVLQTGV